jgi:hypothetical protein
VRKPTESARIEQAFLYLFSIPLRIAAALRNACRCKPRPFRLRLDTAADYCDGIPETAIPMLTVAAIPLEPLFRRQGRRYVETADLRGPLFRRVVNGKHTRYLPC